MPASVARKMPGTASLDVSADSTASNAGAKGVVLRQKETAQYICDMILELRNMAKAMKLFQILVPLEYAYYEAFSVANRVQVPEGEAERISELSKVAGEATGELPDDY
jgi:hypothetical protein